MVVCIYVFAFWSISLMFCIWCSPSVLNPTGLFVQTCAGILCLSFSALYMFGCPNNQGAHTSGSTAHLYLSTDFELNFWSMKRTLCSILSLFLCLPALWTSAAANQHKVYWIKYQYFYLLQINTCSSWCVQVCVCVCVCMWYSDELGEQRLAKSGCHANSVSRLHNRMQQGDGLNLTLLKLTLDTLLPARSHICGCAVHRIKSINLILR